MKKSVKILTLVLSLAILCGALVVAAFADETPAITGIYIGNQADFEGSKYAPGGEKIPVYEDKGSAQTTPIDTDAGNAVQFKHQKGGMPVLVVNPNDNNTYITVDWSQNPNTSSGHFFDTYAAKGPDYAAQKWAVWKDEADAPYFGTKISYYVMDVDLIWNDPASYDGTGFFYPYMGYTTPSGGFKNIEQKIGARFVTVNGQVAVKIQDNNATTVIGSEGTWSHVTFIMGFEVTGEGEAATVKINQYLAVDGKIVDVKLGYTPEVKAADVWASDLTRLYSRDTRFDVFGRKDTSGCADNYTIRTIAPNYNGNLATVLAKGVGADLNEWESDIYDANNMPFGQLVATIGDKKYDDFAKAIADADGSQPIVLASNVNFPVEVNKAVTIVCGDYTFANISAAQGYRPVYDAETKTYTFEAAQGEFYITWESCTCGLDICDETHPGGIDTVGWEGGQLGASYTKDHNWSVAVAPFNYVLVGWTDEDGNLVDLTDEITTEMCEDIIMMTLTPVVEAQTTMFSYVKGEELIYTDDFNEAIDTATGTITLLKDAYYHKYTACKYIKKGFTIDLNGHTLDLTTSAKFNLFGTQNYTVTFIGEKEGSNIVAGYWNGTKGAGTFLTGNAGTVINFVGPNLTISCAALWGNWSSPAITINMDGVVFNQAGASDNPAAIYHKGKANITIKNSIIRSTGTFIGLTNAGLGSTLDFENSTYSGTGDIIASSYNNLAVTIKNSTVYGNINTSETVTVEGACNFSTNGWTSKVEGGVALTEVSGILYYTIPTHKWVPAKESGVCGFNSEETTKFFTETIEGQVKYTTGKTVKVDVKDGETAIASIATIPGAKLLAYAINTPVADGWVNKSINYWYTAGETDATVDLKDITDLGIGYTAGSPNLYFNHTLSDNLTANLYVPAVLPEGLEITNINLNGAHDGRTLTGEYTIGGVAYKATQGWPQGTGADEGINWTLTYTFEEQTFTYKVEMNVVSYAQKVAEIYKNDTEKMTQVTALLQYVEACNKIANTAIANGLSEYLTTLKATYTLPTIPEAVGNMAGLREYITGAKLINVSGKGGAFAFTLSEKAIADAVAIKISTKTQAGERVILTKISDGMVYTFSDSLVAWGHSDLTITVLNAEGESLATGVYSLAAYNTDAEAMGATADQLALLEAIYALAAIGNTND